MYLAVDIGTSSLKAALCEGGSFWVEQLPLQLTQADPCAEQDPREWLEGLAVLLPRLLQRAGASPERIQAVGLSSHSPSLVPVDSHCRPLFPCLTWRDRRAVRQAEKLREQTGEFFDPSFFEPKMLWLKEERPEIYAQTRAFLQPKDFLIAWLTGEFVIDLPAARFSRAQAIGELESGKLPRPCPSWEVVGKTQKRAQELGLAPGIPVVAGGIDAYVEALGAGLVEEGQFGDATGTSTCLSCCLGEGSGVEGAVPHVIPERELCILPLSSGGGTLAWALRQLGGGVRYHELEEALRAVPPGADGLLFLPYLTGERSPLWDEGAKGVFFGITAEHTRAHFLRAVLEGCALAIRHNVEHLEAMGLTPHSARATGGGSRLGLWNQIKADVTGLTYEQLELADGALLGGALLCALAVEKRSEGDLVREYVRTKQVFTPRRQAVYEELYAKYKALYAATKELMR